VKRHYGITRHETVLQKKEWSTRDGISNIFCFMYQFIASLLNSTFFCKTLTVEKQGVCGCSLLRASGVVMEWGLGVISAQWLERRDLRSVSHQKRVQPPLRSFLPPNVSFSFSIHDFKDHFPANLLPLHDSFLTSTRVSASHQNTRPIHPASDLTISSSADFLSSAIS